MKRGVFVIAFSFLVLCSTLAAEKDTISLDFRDAPIEDVLRTIAKQSGYNIIMSEKVKGNVTIHLEDVTPLEAIDAVTTINGFTYTKKGEVFKVTTPEEAEKEKEVTKVFRLNNAKPDEVKAALKSVTEKVEINARSNSVIVTDTPSVINQVTDIIKKLDVETKQVLIEAMFVETKLNKNENLGINWTISATASGSKRPVTFPFSANSHELSKYYPYVTPNDSGSTPSGFPAWGSSLPFSGNPFGFPLASTGDFAFGTLDFTQLSSVLNLLKQRTNTKLISNPKVLTLDNKEATIHVGTKYYIPEYDYSDTGETTISDYYETDIGMSLKVTPHISPGGRIRLELNPSISSITGYTGPVGADGNGERPILYTREVKTEVLVNDGGTVVIGGLIKNETSKTTTKVPILGDIPIIGALFRNVQSPESGNEKTDLLIFVTVHILGNNKNIPFAKLDRFTQRDLRKAIKNYHVNFGSLGLEEIKPKRGAKRIKLEKK